MNSRKSILVLLLLAAIFLSGCGSQEKAAVKPTAEPPINLGEMNEIPGDGIVKAEVFAKFAGQDRTLSFKGKSLEGVEYIWTFNGLTIDHPEDQNLKIDFLLEGKKLEETKAAAAGAPYGIVLKLPGSKDMGTIADLRITLTEKWQADKVVFCQQYSTALEEVATASIDNTGEQTVLTSRLGSTGGTYFFLAGQTEEIETDAKVEDTQQNEKNDEKSTGICTIAIDCQNIGTHQESVGETDSEILKTLPQNGVLLPQTEVTFTEGENAYDVLKRLCDEKGIALGTQWIQEYNSAYVQSVNGVAEGLCGRDSGWLYSVNGSYPDYGCSQYRVKNGDALRWVYTCDLGKDISDYKQ